jgi:hypothetical protein
MNKENLNPYLSGIKTIDAILLPYNYKHKYNNGYNITYTFSGNVLDTPWLKTLFIQEFYRKLTDKANHLNLLSKVTEEIDLENLNYQEAVKERDYSKLLELREALSQKLMKSFNPSENYQKLKKALETYDSTYYSFTKDKLVYFNHFTEIDSIIRGYMNKSSACAYNITLLQQKAEHENLLKNPAATTLFHNMLASMDIDKPNEINEDYFNKIINYYLTHSNPLIDYNYFNRLKDVNMMKEALSAWANVANINFIQDDHDPTFSFLISYNNDYFEEKDEEDSNGFGDCSYYNYQAIKCNYPIFYYHDINTDDQAHVRLFIHEIGHGLGLAHPFEGDIILSGTEATSALSIMAYGPMRTDDGKAIFPSTPMLYDIQAIQYLYGANKEYNKKDTTYYINGEEKLFCIWDAGGNDTINTTEYLGNAKIDLREGLPHQNIIGGSYFWIAFGANIENVITGDGDDIVYGNDLDNMINPGKGNNIIYSGQGNNKFIFAVGNDVIKNFKQSDKIVLPKEIIGGAEELFKSTTFANNNILIDLGSNGSINLEVIGQLNSTSFTLDNIELL